MSLRDGLSARGFDFDSRTFCSWAWSHLLPTEEAMDRTLEIVRRFPSGSEIVSEYGIALELLSREERELIAAADARKKTIGMNEPTFTRFTPAEVEAKLRRIGFSEAIDFSHEEAEDRYFKDRRDGLTFDLASHLMRAIV